MSNDLGLGRLIGKEDKAERDAIHIAVVPVFADVSLRAGEHVGLVDGTLDTGRKNASERSGIVTKPNHDMYFVVQEIPLRQGAMFSGISL